MNFSMIKFMQIEIRTSFCSSKARDWLCCSSHFVKNIVKNCLSFGTKNPNTYLVAKIIDIICGQNLNTYLVEKFTNSICGQNQYLQRLFMNICITILSINQQKQLKRIKVISITIWNRCLQIIISTSNFRK